MEAPKKKFAEYVDPNWKMTILDLRKLNRNGQKVTITLKRA